MAQHTPGPWKVGGNDGGWCVDPPSGAVCTSSQPINAKRRSDPICIMTQRDKYAYGDGDAELDANARLIACAPDLFVALKWFIDDIDGTRTVMLDFDKNVKRARKAIAKAEGRS